MFSLLIIALLSYNAFAQSQPLQEIPVTFYLPAMAMAVPQGNYLYYQIKICEKGRSVRNEALLDISLPDNPTWSNLDKFGFVMAEVSICSRTFIQQCVIATNYIYDIHVTARSNISWYIGNETTYYIRVMAGNLPTQFSMELSFVTDITPFVYNFTSTSNVPFGGETVPPTILPQFFDQYWKTEVMYYVKNKDIVWFAFAYCDQPQSDLHILGIDTVAAAPSDRPFSLIEQWACPQSIQPYTDCTTAAGKLYGWENLLVASFNSLPCRASSDRDTSDGIYIGVEGYGGEPNMYNNFSIHGATILSSV